MTYDNTAAMLPRKLLLVSHPKPSESLAGSDNLGNHKHPLCILPATYNNSNKSLQRCCVHTTCCTVTVYPSYAPLPTDTACAGRGIALLSDIVGNGT